MSEAIKNNTKSMMTSDYGDKKLSKEVELNSGMSIDPASADEYERKIKALKSGGGE